MLIRLNLQFQFKGTKDQKLTVIMKLCGIWSIKVDFIFLQLISGPLAVNVYADAGWMNYHEGVYNGCSVNNNVDINHGVTLVGYGTDEQYGDYWTIRNHWDETWGEKGFMRLSRSSKP